jgi:hypothetical protein
MRISPHGPVSSGFYWIQDMVTRQNTVARFDSAQDDVQILGYMDQTRDAFGPRGRFTVLRPCR